MVVREREGEREGEELERRVGGGGGDEMSTSEYEDRNICW